MAKFDLEFLIGHGLPEDQAAEVLAAHEAALGAALAGMVSREEAQRQADTVVAEALAGMVSREEAQRQTDTAVAEALAGMVSREEAQQQMDAAVAEALAGVDAKAVKQLEAERDMLRAIGGEAFADVKPKFREQVYALLERGEGAKPVAEQLAALREAFEEYFIDAERAPRLPRFGGPTRGSMPRGAIGAAEQFRQTWGFGPGHQD